MFEHFGMLDRFVTVIVDHPMVGFAVAAVHVVAEYLRLALDQAHFLLPLDWSRPVLLLGPMLERHEAHLRAVDLKQYYIIS